MSMKMQIWRIVILLIAGEVLVHARHEGGELNDAKINAHFVSDLSTVTVAEINLDNVALGVALDHVMAVAKETLGEERAMRGIVMAEPSMIDIRMSLRLKRVPLGEIFRVIANLSGTFVVEQSGYVMFMPTSIPDRRLAYTEVNLDERVKAQLRLTQPLSSEDVWTAFKRLGIKIEPGNVSVTPNGRHAIVQASFMEIKLLESAMELISRGLVINLKE